jgi:hypothetical protein
MELPVPQRYLYEQLLTLFSMMPAFSLVTPYRKLRIRGWSHIHRDIENMVVVSSCSNGVYCRPFATE